MDERRYWFFLTLPKLVARMSLEQEMQNEASRLDNEIKDIDTQLKKLHDKVFALLTLREKKEHDMKALKESFATSYIDAETERLLQNAIKGRQKAVH